MVVVYVASQLKRRTGKAGSQLIRFVSIECQYSLGGRSIGCLRFKRDPWIFLLLKIDVTIVTSSDDGVAADLMKDVVKDL